MIPGSAAGHRLGAAIYRGIIVTLGEKLSDFSIRFSVRGLPDA